MPFDSAASTIPHDLRVRERKAARARQRYVRRTSPSVEFGFFLAYILLYVERKLREICTRALERGLTLQWTDVDVRPTRWSLQLEG